MKEEVTYRQKKLKKMKDTNLINNIKNDFSFLKDKIEKGLIHSVLLYGSYSRNEQTARSDIDICIVAPKLKTPEQFSKLLGEIWQNINANKYDVRIFEELPLYIKMDIINAHKIIYSKNLQELYYLFYHFRKIWNDQSVNWIEAK